MGILVGLVQTLYPGIDWRIVLPLSLAFTAWGVYLALKALAGLETAYEAGVEKEKKQKRSIIYAVALIVAPWVIVPLIYNLGLALAPEVPGASQSAVDFLKSSPTPTPTPVMQIQITPP